MTSSGLARFGSAYFLLGVLIILFVAFSLLAPNTFPTAFNLQTMGTSKSIVALLALAVMVPIAANEFDLSVGYAVGLFHILTMGFQVFLGMPWYIAALMVIALGGVLGLVNGLLIAVAKISSFIATLGTGTVIYGLSQAYTGGLQIVSPTPLPRAFLGLTSVIYGVPLPVIFVLVISTLLWFAAEYLPVGRYLYVIGANRRAAELIGIPVARYIIGAFVVSGMLSAMAGVFLASQLRIGQGGVGPEFLLPAFAAALLGATAVRPGRVNVWGTITAVAVLAVGVSGLQQLGAVFYVDPLFSGSTLILSVGLAGWVGRRTASRMSAATALVRRVEARPAREGQSAGPPLCRDDGTMPTLTTSDGVRLHYTDEGSGRPLVFVTGWAMSSSWWREQRRSFAPTNRVVIVDPRAQGDSEMVTFGHRLSRHAADLNDVLSALDLNDVVLVAWSRGTSVALSYIELYGQKRLSGLVLAGFLPSLAARADWPWGFNVPPQPFIDSVVADYPRVVSNMIVDMTHQKLDAASVAAFTAESLQTPPIAAARMLQDHMNVDWRDMLPSITIPVLICAGGEDPQAPAAAAEASAALMPDASVARFAVSGHCPFIEEPEAFNAALRDFSGRV